MPCTKEYEQLLQEAQEAKEQRTPAQLEEQLAKARMDALYGLREVTGYLLGSGEGPCPQLSARILPPPRIWSLRILPI